MGKLMRLRGVRFTDTTGPKIITRDKIESSGSLFLFDGNHEFGQFIGVPGNSAAVPNALANKAAAITSSAESAVNLVVALVSANSSMFKMERTTKGGLHGLITQSGSQVSALQYMIKPSVALRDYILANIAHKFYVSLWTKVTRQALNASSQSPMHLIGSNTANGLFYFESGTPFPTSGASLISRKSDPVIGDIPTQTVSAPYPRFGSVGLNGPYGTGLVAAADINIALGTSGSWATASLNKAPSRIIYRAYMEDLTVSGRTYAEVEAIDYALYQEAFAPGGKFYGDSYTNPSTLP